MVGIRGPWVFGVIVLALLGFLHWLAYRVGEKRQKSRLARQDGARAVTDGDGYRISRSPVRPRRPASSVIEIVDGGGSVEIAKVRALLLEYQASLDVDLGFQGFAREVAELPGSYSPPSGRLLLARTGGLACGCIALQPISSDVCEMKRLYVRPAGRGSGLGRVLVARLLDEARAIGYRRICLDTLPSMTRAAAMYEALGFDEIAPYRHNPVPGTRFMALSL